MGRRIGLTLAVLFGLAICLGATTASARPVSGVTLIAPIALGGNPTWVAVHSGRGRAYVANSSSGTVSVVDLAQATVVTDIRVGPAPAVIAIDPALDRAYVSDFEARTVTVIDLVSNAVVATLPVGGLGIAVDTATHRVYAAGGSHIAVIDGTAARVVATIAAPVGASLWGVAVDPRTARVFATDLFQPRVLVFDGGSGSPLGSVGLAAPARFGIVLDPTGERLYVAGYVSVNAELAVVDASSLQVLARAPVSGLPFSLAVGAPRGLVYVSSVAEGTVSVVSTSGALATRLPVARISLGIAVSGGRLLVVDQHDEVLGRRGRLVVIDLDAALPVKGK